MPQAVTHFLIAAFIVALFRDFYLRNRSKKKFPLHYVLIGGIAGLFPDIDIILFWVLYFFGFTFQEIHRSITHTIFTPLIFLFLALLARNIKFRELGKHKLRLDWILLIFALGCFIHILLDFLLIGFVRPFYPFSMAEYGLNLISYLPGALSSIAIPSLDGVLLVLWMIYLEVKHKISDFI